MRIKGHKDREVAIYRQYVLEMLIEATSGAAPNLAAAARAGASTLMAHAREETREYGESSLGRSEPVHS